jgi:type IV secretory pathway VirD2 relaxase
VSQGSFESKPGRVRDAKHVRARRFAGQVMHRFVMAGHGRTRLGFIPGPVTFNRGRGPGICAAAGLIAPDGRRVIVWARYTLIGGDLHSAHVHLRYLVREGVSREGERGRVYDATSDDAPITPFLRRSRFDRYQFRVLVSPEDGARLQDLRSFIRNLMAQVAHDLGTDLDWIAVDHFNTGHPHTHIVIRGRDDRGHDLVIARDYFKYGIRARARALVTLELGPESDLERVQKLVNEVAQERFTLLDRSLLARAKDGVLAVASMVDSDPIVQTLRVGRLKTLERLGLAKERRPGVWVLGRHVEARLRQLGDRSDKFKMMQRALKEAGIDRGAAALALFERGARKAPLIGKVVGVGMTDEISDRTWVVIDAVDGRIHYAELGRLDPAERPRLGNLVFLGASALGDKPSAAPKLQVLSPVDIEQQCSYEGPTWIDQVLSANGQPDPATAGFGAELTKAFAARVAWLSQRQLMLPSGKAGELAPTADMIRALRQLETERLVPDLARELGATYVPRDDRRICGIYERAVLTPTGRLAVIRREDTFTLAPWKPALEPLRGQAVVGWVGPSRITWTPDRGRSLDRQQSA